jgi:lysyl endopeptidase
MRSKRRVQHHRLAALLASLVLAACGGSGESPGGSSESISKGSDVTASDLESKQSASSINATDAVLQSAAPKGADAQANPVVKVSIDRRAAPNPGISVDLGQPEASTIEKMDRYNRKGNGLERAKRVQNGFARDVTTTSSRKNLQQIEWNATASGVQRASLRFSSTGAAGLRLGVLVQAFPDDAVLRVYAEGSTDAQETTGAHINALIAANVQVDGDSEAVRTYWTPTTVGEAAVLEIDLPAGRPTSSIAFTVPKVMHQTVLAPKASLGQIEQKSTCPNVTPDATCTLPPVTNAVGSMDFVDNSISYVCTGTLVANRGATQQGYFLTANHCINNQSAASSLHVFWFYRSSACNSTTVNPGTVPSFGGALLRYNKTEFSGSLRTPVGTDTALLDLIDTPPAGTIYAGWAFQRDAVGGNTNYLSVHSPYGEEPDPLVQGFLRRSDGRLVGYGSVLNTFVEDGFEYFNVDSSFNTQSPMYQVRWTTGITEGGSSGSGLFADGTTSNPRIVGQLWGGASSCTNTTASDYYGRFDLAYENGLINWLNPGYRMVFRFYNSLNGSHFFSANVAERDTVRATVPSLIYEAPAFMVSPAAGAGLSPVYRFMNRSTGVHFYTINESERAAVAANPGFNYEGIAWYARQASSPAAGTIQVFRFLRRATGTHLYTVSVAEKDNIIATRAAEYAYEGVAYLAWGAN